MSAIVASVTGCAYRRSVFPVTAFVPQTLEPCTGTSWSETARVQGSRISERRGWSPIGIKLSRKCGIEQELAGAGFLTASGLSAHPCQLLL